MRVVTFFLGVVLAAGATGAAVASDSGFVTYGHPALEAIDDAYRSGQISEAEAVLYRFYFCKNLEKLPAEFRLEGPPLKSATSILADVYGRMDQLPAAMVDEIMRERTRPYGLNETRTTAHYIIHYTLSGGDAVPNEAYVDVVEQACEDSWQEFHVDQEWLCPPGDGGMGGGTDMIDCYVHALPYGTLGMAEYENPVPGDPPYDYTGFFHVDNGISNAGTRSCTVSHENMHVIQFGYQAGSGAIAWYWENCAMVAEEWVYDNYNDYFGYLQSWFGFPYKSLKTFNGQYEYGGIVWPMYKWERFGDVDIVENVYEHVRWNGPGEIWDGFDIALAPYGYDFMSAYLELMRWCFYTRYRDDGQHFEEAGYWTAQFYYDLSFNSYPTGEQHPRTSPVDKRPEPIGTSLMEFQPEAGGQEMLEVTLDGPSLYTAGCEFIRKQAGQDVWYEYFMEVDEASGDGVIQIPYFDQSDYVWMLTSVGLAPGGPRDYAFWADDVEGSGDVPGGEQASDLVRIWPFRPNPVVDNSTIHYSLARAGEVSVRILDASGRLVRDLYSGHLQPGNYDLMWDGANGSGQEVPAGIYFAHVALNGAQQTRQITVLR
ncbi:MAG: hypothetical protein GF330_03060 [Candidatus Eisenbacteria bacterium]|nr:hypothetical protein [Candidatus Eisenbacteria bacterium]